MYQVVGLPASVSCPGFRNVNDKENLPLVSVSKGCTSLLKVENDPHMNQIAIMTENFLTILRNELIVLKFSVFCAFCMYLGFFLFF